MGRVKSWWMEQIDQVCFGYECDRDRASAYEKLLELHVPDSIASELLDHVDEHIAD